MQRGKPENILSFPILWLKCVTHTHITMSKDGGSIPLACTAPKLCHLSHLYTKPEVSPHCGHSVYIEGLFGEDS
jgi:hypothetical protein